MFININSYANSGLGWNGNCYQIQNFKGEKLSRPTNFKIYGMEIFYNFAYALTLKEAKSHARVNLLNKVKRKCQKVPSDLKFIIQCPVDSDHIKKFHVIAVTKRCSEKFKNTKLETERKRGPKKTNPKAIKNQCRSGETIACNKGLLHAFYKDKPSLQRKYASALCKQNDKLGCFLKVLLSKNKYSSITSLVTLCKKKNSRACKKLGDNELKARNLKSAISYYEKACHLKNTKSCGLQGYLLKLTGQKVLGDRLLKKSCQKGNTISCADLAPKKRIKFCQEGLEKACQDEFMETQNVKMLSKSCQLNNANSCYKMAQINLKNKDYSLSHLRFTKSCLLGNLRACKNIVLIAPNASGGEIEINTNLCKNGDQKSCTYLAIANFKQKKYKLALGDLTGLCKKGDQLSCYYKALSLSKLNKLPEAIIELGKLCTKESPLVCLTLSKFQNGKDRIKTLRKGCKFKEHQSCFNLATKSKKNSQAQRKYYSESCLYANAQGCEKAGKILLKLKDNKTAKAYFKKGCRLEFANSCNSLASLSNKKEKNILLKKACKLGHKKSCP